MTLDNEDRISLKTYVDTMFQERDKQLSLALAASQKAIDKAEAALALRLEGMNEVRDQLNRQASTFVSRAEFELLKERFDTASGRSAGIWAAGAVMLSVFSLVLVVLFHFQS